MFWRKFKLDWTYALGEVLIVTLGVLIALGVDGWNDARLQRAEERNVVARLISDIEGDLRRFEFQLGAIDRKEQTLQRLRTAFGSDGPVDAAGFLADIADGANFGWNQMTANRATFEGLLESGRLALIEDTDVRALVTEYYRSSEQAINRMDERETPYPDLSYRLIPRGPAIVRASGVGDGNLESGLGDDALNKLVKAARQSALGDQVIAEINFTRFVRGITGYLRTQGSELLTRLREYQKKIE